jgi:hypothetical protein
VPALLLSDGEAAGESVSGDADETDATAVIAQHAKATAVGRPTIARWFAEAGIAFEFCFRWSFAQGALWSYCIVRCGRVTVTPWSRLLAVALVCCE